MLRNRHSYSFFWAYSFFWVFLFVLFLYLALWGHDAMAQSSLGIGVAEPVAKPSSSFFGQIFLTIQIWQKKFERLVGGWLISMHDNPWQAVKLLGISFLYGILHASGPGHGKAVISSYLIANRETIKRGIFLSFWSSLLQAFTAIAIIAVVYWFLPAKLTAASNFMVRLSFLLIMLLGLWLLWRKTKQILLFYYQSRKKNNQYSHLFAENGNNWRKEEQILNNAEQPNQENHTFKGVGGNCDICGSAHVFSANILENKINLKQAAIAVISVGIRPCTGALFVMSYTMLNGLFLIGALSVLFMALGTFITVALMAAFAVKAKNIMENWQNSLITKQILPILEWVFALFIFLFGFTFLIA